MAADAQSFVLFYIFQALNSRWSSQVSVEDEDFHNIATQFRRLSYASLVRHLNI